MQRCAVACTACGAQPGNLCTSHSGTRPRRSDVHRARTAAHQKQASAGRPAMTMREIREALGHEIPTPAAEQPIEPGQVYRPTPDNARRRPADRITVTRMWTADDADEPSYAFDIATVDYRGRPITTHSALRESVFRQCYALDVPEPNPADVAKAQAYRDAADEINALPQDYETDPGRGDAAEFLRRRAAEIHPAG